MILVDTFNQKGPYLCSFKVEYWLSTKMIVSVATRFMLVFYGQSEFHSIIPDKNGGPQK